MTSLPMTGALTGADRPPGVRIELLDPPPAVEPARVDVPAFVCVCERGPVDTPVRVGSWSAFAQVFGGFVGNGLGAYAVKAFFEQGGRVCWVVRVAAPTVTTTAAPPQPLDRTRSTLASTVGFAVGAAATLVQGASVHTYLVTAVDDALAQVTWDRPLHPNLDTTLPMAVSTGAGAAVGVLVDDAAAPSLLLAAASAGAWGNAVVVVAAPGARTTTASRDSGSPLHTPVMTTAGFALGDRVRISQDSGGVVVTGTVVLSAIDATERVLSWDGPLPAGLDLAATFSLETTTTSLTVLERGTVVETWPDLSLQPKHLRYAPNVLEASARLRVAVAGTEPPRPARVALRGGRDGTAGLVVADLLGDELLGDRGAATLVPVDEPALLAVPDLVAPPTPARVLAPPPPPDPCDPCAEGETVPDALDATIVDAGATFAAEEVVTAQLRLVETCERSTERVALLDPPCSAGAATTLHDLRAWAARFSSSFAVAVVPWLTVLDPLQPRRVRRVPASGHLAGMIARCDAESGPWLAPANRSLAWAHGVDADLTDVEHAIANGDGMLVVRSLPGRGVVPMGARTRSAESLWTFLTVRRTMIGLRRTLRQHLAWSVFEPCDRGLALAISSVIATLMEQIWSSGGLSGATAAESYLLSVDLERAALGELGVDLAVALARPAEWVTIRVSRTDNRLDVTERPQRVGLGATS